METSPVCITMANREGQIIFANPGAEEVLGMPEDEITQLTYNAPDWHITDFDGRSIPDEQLPFRRVMETGGPVYDVHQAIEWPNLQRVLLSVNAAPVFDGSDQVDGVAFAIEDVTEQVQTASALRESEEKYRSLVESTEDSIYLVDRDCRYLFMNQKHLSRFRLAPDKVIGRPYGEFHSERETREFINKVNEVFETGKSLWHEYRSQRDGGYFLRTLSPVKEPEGRTTAVTVVSKDITERKQSEEALRESQRRLRFLSSQLIASQEKERRRISLELHDELGQALTAVDLNLTEMERKLPSNLVPVIRERLSETHSIIDQTLEQIRELSLYLRPSMLDDLGLIPTLRWHLNRFSKRTNMEVKFEMIDLDERLGADVETVLYRVVQEALNNVAKHAEAKKALVRLERKGEAIAIYIKDDGKGFDVNETLVPGDPEGGIGLLGMQERVAILGGSFNIQSRKRHGTQIIAEIPVGIDD
jgi:PAS domain S-box-containing protein